MPLKAQLDLEHWFPPVYRTGGGITEIYFYLSTDKTTPFQVKVFNNNVLLKTLTISNAAPASFVLDDSSMIYATAESRTMKPNTMGIHITGEKSFYASLRMASGPGSTGARVSEIMASKGKSALGNDFLVVTDQNILYGNPGNNMNSEVSVMATRDNTHVKLSRYNSDIVFCNGVTDDELNFTLNKGESYIVAMQKLQNNPSGVLDDNDPNFIGAKITSDQMIVVNNGNFMSQNIGEPGGNVNMDQSMPISKIGKEYFIANGMTKTQSLMEKTLIVATKNNTKIFFNDDSVPLVTLNAGEHYIGPYPNSNDRWIPGGMQEFTNSEGHIIVSKGMYIHGSEPFYLYQMVGGFQNFVRGPTTDKTEISSGMTFSYPLDQNYLPDPRQNLTNLIQVPIINKIGVVTTDNKITIKTVNGANVKINGVPVTNFAGIPGKDGWSYFSQPYNVGNVNITSDRSLMIDVVGGYPYSGFGSSYTGFSNDPFIIKNGNCVQEGVYLYLNNNFFERFQWQLNGVDIPGATSSEYQPVVAGSYTCICYYPGFSFTTTPVVVDDCPYTLTNKDLGKYCHSFTIEPRFSPPKTKIEVQTLEVLTQPYQGSASVVDGAIVVTINENFSGDNRIIYKMTAADGYYEIVKGSFYIYPSPTATTFESIIPKTVTSTNYIYDLTTAISANPDKNMVKFYPSQNDAEINSAEITGNRITNYVTTQTEVFAKFFDNNSCYIIRKIILLQPKVPNPPEPGADNELSNFFSPNGDGVNDIWDYAILGSPAEIKLAIFDRYGKMVYQHSTKTFWDGKSPTGIVFPTGSYWVYYVFKDSTGASLQKSSWIMLKSRN